jgi:riboflavin synthase
MFTGIIEEVGRVVELRRRGGGANMVISSSRLWKELGIGESVCVNGVCLTVVEKGGGKFAADLSEESLSRSTLGGLRKETPLNLERALTLGARLGGHIVQGHVDGIGKVKEIKDSGGSRVYTFSYPEELQGYLVEKGSIAVDGISLTVSALGGSEFSVAVIPLTLKETNLGSLRTGDAVNLETDIIAKYVRSFLQNGARSTPYVDHKDQDLYRKLLEGGFA